MKTNKRKKLTLDQVETQMEVLTKEEMNALKGGIGENGSVVIFITRVKSGNNGTPDNPNDDWTISVYSGVDSNDEYFGGYIMEPGGEPTTASGQDRPIPAGIYNLFEGGSKGKYGLYSDDVSRDRGIKIHTGNTGSDTEGCLLPGSNVEFGSNERAILRGSKVSYEDIKRRIEEAGYKNVEIIITE